MTWEDVGEFVRIMTVGVLVALYAVAIAVAMAATMLAPFAVTYWFFAWMLGGAS